MNENQTIEWKENWRDEYLKWVCAFANAEGGTLVIGRNDKGEVTGLKNSHRLMEEIPNKVRDLLGIMVAVDLREESGKEYIEVSVEPYPYPISYRGGYYFRSGSTTQELKGAALDRFLLGRQGRHWDGVPLPDVALAELNPGSLAEFRRRAARTGRLSEEILGESDEMLVDKLHLSEGSHLKRAAVLLFHADPERFVTGAYIKVGYFENNADLRYQDEIHGDLFTQVFRTIETLRAKYLKARISYEGVQRVESLPIPNEALREAVLNAICHKDYSSGVPIQISVHRDKLLLWNPGQLPADWTVERLMLKHASLPFNPDIANTFFRAGMIEAWGRGIERMLEACRSAGAPTPILTYDHTGLWVEFSFPEPLEEQADATTQETVQETTQERTLTQPESQPESQPETQPESLNMKVLVLLSGKSLSKKQLSDGLGQKVVSGQLNRVIRELLAGQAIERTIPEKPNSSLQKYRLTSIGRELLAKLTGREVI